MRRSALALLCLAPPLLLAVTAFSCVSQPESSPAPSPRPEKSVESAAEETIVLRGYVRVFGNEPHTYAGIELEGKSKTYAVYPADAEMKVRALQGHLVEFTAIALDGPKGEGGLYLSDGTVTPLSWKILK